MTDAQANASTPPRIVAARAAAPSVLEGPNGGRARVARLRQELAQLHAYGRGGLGPALSMRMNWMPFAISVLSALIASSFFSEIGRSAVHSGDIVGPFPCFVALAIISPAFFALGLFFVSQTHASFLEAARKNREPLSRGPAAGLSFAEKEALIERELKAAEEALSLLESMASHAPREDDRSEERL